MADDQALEVIDYLLYEIKLPIDSVNENGDTALHICAGNGSINSLLTLLSKLIGEDSESDTGDSPNTDKEAIKAIINKRNAQGNTILHLCALAKKFQLIEKIRQNCSQFLDESITNEDGKTARDLEKLAKEDEFRK